jgi:hypothetical protein
LLGYRRWCAESQVATGSLTVGADLTGVDLTGADLTGAIGRRQSTQRTNPGRRSPRAQGSADGGKAFCPQCSSTDTIVTT